ncbi:MAG: polyhydroxyalkanoic acid system family protein [Thermoguttaceae bacterium]|nr:polyhydroxyalkanoic acid system family protein [Thermoguttaceae bacterium]
MPNLTKTYPHSLGKEEAARRLKERIASEKINKANIASVSKEVWNDPYNLDFSMTLFNYRVDGTLKIGDSDVVVNLNLPFVAMMVKGMIEDQMQQQMDAMLA